MGERSLSPFSTFSTVVAAGSAGLGVLTLAGWLLGASSLSAPIDAALPMKANTAVALALLGAGLALAARSDGRSRMTMVLGTGVALLALATVAQDVVGRSFGIDELLVRDALSPAPQTLAPGRMSPVTAGALFLLAVSLAGLHLRGRASRWLTPLVAFGATLIAMESLVGLALGADEFLTFGPFNVIAPQTSIGLLGLSAGILALRADVPPASFWVRTDLGAALARRLIPPAFVLPPVLGWIQIAEQRRRAWDPELGTALFAFAVSAVATGLVLWTAAALRRSDDGRLAADALHRASEEEKEILKEQLLQSQKMDAIGRLAGGVAHDFNNLLTAIIGYADLLHESLVEDESRAHLNEIRRAADRAAALTKQLLAFSRKQVLRPAVLDLNEVAREAQSLLGRVIGEDVRLVLRLGPTVPCVRADRGQLEQVLMNLAVNARDAMPGGGTLTLATAVKTMDEASAAIRPGLRPGLYASLSVSDTGAGMTCEVHARLFEPFFTTKERGKGTGLGLATTYGIVKQSDGFIWADSVVGSGTTFEILLPAVAESPDEPVPHPAMARRGGETVLVVEDEASVRKLVRTALEANGYAVLDAASGEEALDVARAHRGPVHLLLTDVVMPGMNGRELAGRITARYPEARVLFMSGYTDDAIGRHGVLEPGTDFLEKPFAPAQVAGRVRAALDRA